MAVETPVRKRRWRRRILLLLPLLVVSVVVGRRLFGGPSVPDGSYVLLDLQGDYPERPPESLLGRLVFERPLSLLDLLLLIRDAREDERVAGMVVRVRALA